MDTHSHRLTVPVTLTRHEETVHAVKMEAASVTRRITTSVFDVEFRDNVVLNSGYSATLLWLESNL